VLSNAIYFTPEGTKDPQFNQLPCYHV